MKSLLVVAFIVTVVAFSGNAVAEEKAYVPKQDEELYGTWVNPDYPGGKKDQKIVLHPDGRYERFSKQWFKDPDSRESYMMTDKWTDSEGNIWYKVQRSRPHYELYQLHRISNSGKTMEYVRDRTDYPTEIDPEEHFYLIYYRQE
jgi:hypothetical protein